MLRRVLAWGALQRLRHLRSELTWVAIGQGLAFIGSFFSVKVLTNVLGPREYGELAFGITVAGLIQIFIYGPLGQVIIRFLSICRERAQLSTYFFLARRVHLICAAIVMAGIAASSVLTDRLVGPQWALVVLFGGLYGLGSGVNISFASFQAALRQRRVVALHQGAENWFRPLFALVLLFVFWKSGYLALLGFFVAVVLVDISQLRFARKSSVFQASWNVLPNRQDVIQYRRELLAYGAPFLVWAGVGSVSMFGDRWTLQYLSGARELGIYAALYQIANAPVTVLGGVVTQLMVPVIFDRAGALSSPQQAKRSLSLLYKTMALFVFSMAAMGILIYRFSESLTRFATSPIIALSHGLLWVIFLGLVVFQLAQMMVVVGQIYRKTKGYIVAYAVNAVATIGCSYVLGKKYGIRGIAIALCVSNASYLIAVLGVNWRIRAAVTKAWKSLEVKPSNADMKLQQLGAEHALESLL